MEPTPTPNRPLCYLMSILTPGAESGKWYAVAADDLAQAKALVPDYCNIASAKIEFERVLTDTTIKRLKLKRGEVKRFS